MEKIGKKFRIYLVVTAFILLTLIILGIFSLLSAPEFTPGLALSLFAGMSMIFLPCTFPLVFIIVPLAMSESPKKGLIMALLFGLGLTLTFTLYGVVTGLVGGYIGLSKVVRGMLVLGGVTALLFGVAELKLIKFKLPFKQTILPERFQKSSDYTRSFLLGFFLGNAGVGCPNPAFYILFGYVATIGQASTGAYLGAIHGIGRMIPLFLFVILAIVGVNATGVLSKWQGKAKRVVAWSMVALGSFILMYGIYSHTWFEESILHKGWNNFVALVWPKIAESGGSAASLRMQEGMGGTWPWVAFAVVIAGVLIWDAVKRRRDDSTREDALNETKETV